MYFHLAGECYLRPGRSGGAVYNLLTKEIVSLDTAETELLLKAERGEPCDRTPLFLELEKMGWGIFADQNFFVDKIRPYNEFLLMRPDLRPPVMNAVYLQLTDQCACPEEYCRKMFCTPCRSGGSGFRKNLTAKQWITILDKLKAAGAKQIILTGGDVSRYEDWRKVATACVDKKLSCTMVLNRFDHALMEQLPPEISLIVYACRKEEMEGYKKILAQRRDASLILNDQTAPLWKGDGLADGQGTDGQVPDGQRTDEEGADGQRKVLVARNTGQVPLQRISPCDVALFYRRKDSNACLDGSMYILCDGSVVPCYQKIDTVLGNLITEPFYHVYRNLAETIWNVPNSHKKCFTCQWYYGCDVCMCMDPETQCTL